MAKLHTKRKRRYGLTSNRGFKKTMLNPRKKRAKTFVSEESADIWAKENNIKEYSLKKVKKGKRFEIV